MTQPAGPDLGKTALRRIEQYKDRWTSVGVEAGLIALSDKPSVGELRQYEIFASYDDAFLEKISPDVSIAMWREGAILFEQGSYIDVAFFVVAGAVEVFVAGSAGSAIPIFDASRTVPPVGAQAVAETTLAGPTSIEHSSAGEITFLASLDLDLPAGASATLEEGDVLGEIGALSGWPQSVTARTASPCRLVQIRVSALRLMKRKSKDFKERLDKLYRERSLGAQLANAPLFRGCSRFFLEALKEIVELISLDPGQVLVEEGQPASDIYMVRSGFLKLSQVFGAGELVVTYLSKGMTLGEVEYLVDGVDTWRTTATSVEYSEVLRIPAKEGMGVLLRAFPEAEELLWKTVVDRIKETGYSRRDIGHAEFTKVALDHGLVQGSSILVIDLDACTRCDDCVRACAATHDGRPRFIREGNKYDNLLVARSCYHCRDPVCLVGCPTGAIHRAGVGEVVEIDDRICIGCSSCARNCPYDAIVMFETGETWADDMLPVGLRGRDRLVASKCDLCHDRGHGPACVENCPQGCAFRVGSLDDFRDLTRGRRS